MNLHLSLGHIFVDCFNDIYGKEVVTCNMHGLLQLARDSKTFDPLIVSSIPFENCLSPSKKHLQKPHLPLQQVV